MALLVVVSVFSIMRPFPLRTAGYNPLAMTCEDRALDIMSEAGNFDVTMIAGTCVPETAGGIPNRVLSGSTMYSAGYVRSRSVNKSCGTAIVIGKRLARCKVHPTVKAPAPIAGRGMSMRVSSRWVDCTPIVAYYPPIPWSKDLYPQYRITCRELTCWLSKVLDGTPGCSTPLLYVDLNDGMGIQQIGSEWVPLDDLSCVSPEARNREKKPGGAGELFRELLTTHGMASLSTWFDQRPTFYGNTGSSSMIDHLCGPEALVHSLRSAGPLGGMSRRLQLIQKRGHADHLLVHAVFYYVLAHPPKASLADSPQASILGDHLDASKVKWDPDLLMRGLREGYRREEFLQAAEDVMEGFLDTHGHLLEHRTPDELFIAMDAAFIKAGLKFYGRGTEEVPAALTALKERRLQLLSERRELRARRVDPTVPEPEEAELAIQLEAATKACRQARRDFYSKKE
jgi:hypothetical protein